ncbi:MAG TPA: hypothetical protein VMX97_17820 [Hyphomicrobiaceae bacterium]|nr:hypothetical protein [Hyphomicrobiaceae bacterium]
MGVNEPEIYNNAENDLSHNGWDDWLKYRDGGGGLNFVEWIGNGKPEGLEATVDCYSEINYPNLLYAASRNCLGDLDDIHPELRNAIAWIVNKEDIARRELKALKDEMMIAKTDAALDRLDIEELNTNINMVYCALDSALDTVGKLWKRVDVHEEK